MVLSLLAEHRIWISSDTLDVTDAFENPSLFPICACQCVRFNIWGNSVVNKCILSYNWDEETNSYLFVPRQTIFLLTFTVMKIFRCCVFFFQDFEVNSDYCSLYLFWKLIIGSRSHTAYKVIFNCFNCIQEIVLLKWIYSGCIWSPLKNVPMAWKQKSIIK